MRQGYDSRPADGGVDDARALDGSRRDGVLDAPAETATSDIGPDGGASFLLDLVPSRGVLTPPFSPGTPSYAVSVGLWVDTITFTPTTAPGASITVNGQPVHSGSASQALTLALGSNQVTVIVDREGETRTHVVDVRRASGVIGYLKASNTGAGDRFGHSVSLSGDTLAVGAGDEASSATGVNGNQADNSAPYAGAVYVFTRTGTTWSQQAYLKASNTGVNDNFGTSVALSGDTLGVGASGEDSSATGVGGDQSSNAATGSGAVYVIH